MAEDKKKDEIAVIDITEEYLKERIYEIRGQRVILDADLSEIYGYTTKAFNQQVKNNIEKFDEDFMFELTDDEVENLRSNFLTANLNSKSRYNPHVFTEQGLYMLMTVLKGPLRCLTAGNMNYISSADAAMPGQDCTRIFWRKPFRLHALKERGREDRGGWYHGKTDKDRSGYTFSTDLRRQKDRNRRVFLRGEKSHGTAGSCGYPREKRIPH